MEGLERFLDAPVDYSPQFTERVAALGMTLSEALGAPVRHDTDMNYNPGQLLVVHLGPDGTVTGDEVAAAHAVKVAVSSRGPLWAVLAWRKGGGPRVWHPASTSDIGAGVLARIEEVMRAAGLSRPPSSSPSPAAPPSSTAPPPPYATCSSASCAEAATQPRSPAVSSSTGTHKEG